MQTNAPPPPSGYATWLDFAVETFDTRGLWLDQLFQDGPEADRDAMREAARQELRLLREQVSGNSHVAPDPGSGEAC